MVRGEREAMGGSDEPTDRACGPSFTQPACVRTVKLVTAGRCSKASKDREQVSKEEVELFRTEGGLRRFVGPAKRR